MGVGVGTAILIATALGGTAAAVSGEQQRKAASRQAAAIRAQGVQEPPATPEVGTGARDELRRRAKSKLSSRRKTIVTGDLTPPSAKKTLLG